MPWGFVAGAAISAVGGAIASGNAEDASEAATQAQSASASDANKLARDRLTWDQSVYNDNKPLRDAVTQQALDVGKQQLDTSKQQAAIAADYDNYNKTTFRPLEQQLVTDAQGYDTPERRAAAMESARADTENAFAGSQAALQRQLGRSGVTMGSGRSLALLQDASLAKAGAVAGATTDASRNIETQGHARMMDAASLGRGLPSAQATAAATGVGAGTAATNAGVNAINASTSGIASVDGAYSGAASTALGAGQLYGQVASAYGKTADEDAAAWGKLGSAAGSYLSYMSDKRKKKGTGKRLDPDAALEGIEKTPVDKGWKYDASKGGVDDGEAEHDGPMAQDVRKNMGADVSDGTKIDIPSMHGHMMAGMQSLSKRMKRLERRA